MATLDGKSIALEGNIVNYQTKLVSAIYLTITRAHIWYNNY